jgi:protease PrsW
MEFICSRCGTLVPEGQFYCSQCGAAVPTVAAGPQQLAQTMMHSQAAPTVVIRSANKLSAMKVMLAVFASLVALLLGLIVLYLIGVETGPVALLAGLIFATLPVPIYITLILWLDRYESEPLWLLAVVFFWGATVAVFIAFVLNTTGALLVASSAGMEAAEAFSLVISAPVVEESAKGLVLFIVFFWQKDEFDGILDGIVYAAMVGLGFAMTENIQYYGRAALEGGIAGSRNLFFLRGAIAPFSHPLFTSMTGIGLGWARQSNNKFIKYAMPLIGLGLAMFLHALWNGSAYIHGLLWIVTYLFVMVPIFIAALIVVGFALRREGRIVREHLICDFHGGLLSQEEYARLCSVRGRMGASFRALRNGGFGVWRTRMQYNQLASELAFHRSRVARGLHDDEQTAREREAAYVELLRDLRRRLGSH